MPAIERLTIRRSRAAGRATFLLHWRNPAKVATPAGIFGLIQVGEFQPSSIASWDRQDDFDYVEIAGQAGSRAPTWPSPAPDRDRLGPTKAGTDLTVGVSSGDRDNPGTRRVVLVGDAAWCMTTYSGMGASSSLRGGAALATALQEHPDDLDAALDACEAGLRPFITEQQRAARLKQQWFVPSSRRAEAPRAVVLGLARGIVHRQLAAEATAPPAPALSGTTR